MCSFIASTLFLDLHFLCPLSSLTFFYLSILISPSVWIFWFAFYGIVNFLVTCRFDIIYIPPYRLQILSAYRPTWWMFSVLISHLQSRFPTTIPPSSIRPQCIWDRVALSLKTFFFSKFFTLLMTNYHYHSNHLALKPVYIWLTLPFDLHAYWSFLILCKSFSPFLPPRVALLPLVVYLQLL